MKTLTFIAALLAAPLAANAAAVTEIHCKTEKVIEDRSKEKTEITMRVENLESGKIGWGVVGDDDENPIKMIPKDSVLDINDNLEMSRDKDGNLRIRADGDGETSTEVLIYKDKDFHAGYASVKFNDGNGPKGAKGVYSPISCTVKK
ncbi:MAG: hypothetical protein ACXVB9_10210 [Bdellovibrionota bacterium]